MFFHGLTPSIPERRSFELQMLRAFPMGQALVGTRPPVGAHLGPLDNARDTTLGGKHPGLFQIAQTEIVGVRHADGVAGFGLIHAERLEPVEAEAGRSEEPTSELQTQMRNSYTVYCL